MNTTEVAADEGLSTEALAAIVIGATVGTAAIATVGVVTAVGVGATAAGAGAAAVGTGAAVAGAGAAAAAGAGAAGAGAAAAGVGATAAGAGATAAGAAATVAGAGATVAGSATTGAATIAAVAGSVAGVAITTAAALLAKYGLKRRSLDKTNLLTLETPAQRMVSKDVLEVKDAPDMTLLESVRHMTFLLSDKNIKFIKGRRSKKTKAIEHEIEKYNVISHVLSARHTEGEHETADAAERMQRVSSREKLSLYPITESDRDFLISTAKRCLSWARDPARVAVHGAVNVTVEEVCCQDPRDPS